VQDFTMKTTRRNQPPGGKVEKRRPAQKTRVDTPPEQSAPPPVAAEPNAALKALGLGQQLATKKKNAGAHATTLGAKLMGFVGNGVKKAVATLSLGMVLMGAAVQPAAADVVLVEQGSSRHLQQVARQLAGETGEGFVHVKSEPGALRAALQRIESGQGDADHLILEGNVNVAQLEQLRAQFPQAFASVRYVHVVGQNVAADPFAGKGKALFPNAVGVVGFNIDPAVGPGASAWLVQESGRQLYAMPGSGLSPQAALIQARSIANQAAKLGVSSTVTVQDQHVTQQAETKKPDIQLTYTEAQARNTSEIYFTVPEHQRNVQDGQSVLVPLEAGRELHVIELKYHDTRPMKDIELSRRPRGSGGEWQPFRGDELKASEERERAGEIEIKREPDHNNPWINNPIRVKVEFVDAQGNVLHTSATKLVDPQLHDAWGPDAPGSAEIDNLYMSLYPGKLPPGTQLRLTAVHQNRKPWEADRTVAMELSYVKPVYVTEHSARAWIRQGGWETPSAQGYDVEPGRAIAAVRVQWTDHGKPYSGSVRVNTPSGEHRSPTYNVGSGETKLIPLDGAVSKDGKLFIDGFGVEVGNIEVLYK
jgi:hypothetical protein